MDQRYVGEILVRRGVVTADRVDDALRIAKERRTRVLDVLVQSRAAEEAAIVRALADEVGIPFIEKIKIDAVPAELVELVPINFARQNRVIPVAERDGVVEVAVANPLDVHSIDDLRVLLRKPVEAVASTSEAIEDAINRLYARKEEDALSEGKESEAEEELQDLIDTTDEAPVIRWVNNLFYNAVRDRASDIHVEPGDREVIVRYRIDGDLYPVKTAHKGFLSSIVARIKIEAGLNIAEKRLPQDGRITKRIHGKLVDVRVSTIPTARGERIVMRLLDKEKVLLDVTDLGFDPAQLSAMEDLITRPNGIFLVTGPTGSGKTTTLYACLNKINRPDINIMTVEDPVEYELPGTAQMQVAPKIGLTFANGHRAFLRQDPDVVMVGEIRDKETAEIAINASLTGHLVLSTIHTNDAPGAITRLIDMGVAPFLISSSLLASLAQRLVRRLCPLCKTPYTPTVADLQSLGFDPSSIETEIERLRSGEQLFGILKEHEIDPSDLAYDDDTQRASRPPQNREIPPPALKPTVSKDVVFYRAKGCDACAGTGYRGRLGIYELLIIDETIRQEILKSSDSNRVMKIAIARGMRPLREDGARQVLNGVTSLEDVLAATQAQEA